MSLVMRDLVVFGELAIVRIQGFEAPKYWDVVDGRYVTLDGAPDPVGTANWLCEQYGMHRDNFDTCEPGILWTDYDSPGWEFTVLIAADEADRLAAFCRGAEYTVLASEPVTEPMHYGDGGGTVTVLRHPDGWVIVRS